MREVPPTVGARAGLADLCGAVRVCACVCVCVRACVCVRVCVLVLVLKGSVFECDVYAYIFLIYCAYVCDSDARVSE